MRPFSSFSPILALALLASARAQTTSSASASGSSSAIALDPLVVTRDLDKAREDIVPGLGATEYTINPEQIAAQSLGANGGFNQVLLRAPGVAQDSYGQVHLRGEHANLQYRINDVLLPEGISGFGQELDTPFVQSVSIVTGSLPAQYGYRTAGVVDIHTQSGASLKHPWETTLFGGSFDTLRASVSGAATTGKVSTFFTASVDRNDIGIENPTSSRDPIHDRTRQLKLFGDFSYIIDSSSRLTLLVSGSFERFQIPNNPGQDPAFTLNGVPSFDSAQLNENQRQENDYVAVAYQKTTEDFSLQVSAFSRYSLVKFSPDRAGDLIFNGVASSVHRDLVGNGLEIDGKWSISPTHTIRAGGLATATNAVTSTTTAVFPTDLAGDQASSTPFNLIDNSRKLGWLYGVYIQDEWKMGDHLTMNYGVRADASRAYLDESQLSPRLNLVYQIDDTTSLHAGYARYFTPPPLELVQTNSVVKFVDTTNEAPSTVSSLVRSERSDYFDTGVTHQFSSELSATLDGYYKHATNQLDEGQFGTALIFSPFNYRVGHIYGVEVSTNFTRGGFSAYANAALSRATGREIVSGEFQFDPDELAYIAAHDVHLDHDQTYTVSAGTMYRFLNTMLFADILYGSGLRRGFANTDHLPEYHPINLGIERTFKLERKREIHARLEVVNVFDESYALRDGSGIGVGAPQYGQRRGFYGTLGIAF